MKKFELTNNTKINFLGKTLFQIKALISFGNVSAGDLGGWVEKEENLSHDGNAWVYGNAWVSGDARVYGNARVSGDARVSGNAWVSGDARVSGNAWVSGDARVYGNARVSGDARVSHDRDYTTIKGFGRQCRNTTFFRCKDGLIRVNCGCFFGTISEFENKVRETHKETKFAKEYLMIAKLMKLHFEVDKNES